jgi:hypothetical protein
VGYRHPHRWAQLRISRTINLKSNIPKIIANILLPEGIKSEEIDSSYRLMLYPAWPQQSNPIEAYYQQVHQYKANGIERTGILAYFEKPDLASGVTAGQDLKFIISGKLICGQYFFGSDLIKIINPLNPKR